MAAQARIETLGGFCYWWGDPAKISPISSGTNRPGPYQAWTDYFVEMIAIGWLRRIDAVALPPDPNQARPRPQKAAETGPASDQALDPSDPEAPVASRQVLERARRGPRKAAETGPASDQALDPSDPEAPEAPWQELVEACAG